MQIFNKIANKISKFKRLPLPYLFDYISRKILSKYDGIYLCSVGKNFYLSKNCTILGSRYITVGDNFYAGQGAWIECLDEHLGHHFNPCIRIGDNVSLSHSVHIAAIGNVLIGNDVLLGSRIIITDHNHGLYSGDSPSDPNVPPSLRPLSKKKANLIIEDNVWICDGVVVLSGVTIGKGSVISANSVVINDVPPFSIASGAPATVIKRYDTYTQKWSRLDKHE